MKHIIYVEILNCICDFLAVFFRGELFVGARSYIEIFNILYFISGSVISYLWLLYVINQIDDRYNNLKMRVILAIPLLIIILSFFFNPFTNFYFSIDENNLYQRGSGLVLYWCVTVLYVISATIVAHVNYLLSKNPIKRNLYKSLLKFAIPAAIGCIVQFLFYGITSNQIGVVLSILLIFFDAEASLVLKDELTGLSNRRALYKYVFAILEKHSLVRFSIIIVHVENLIKINDFYGRQEGDVALKNSGKILMQALRETTKKASLYRYNSGEFVILSTEYKEKDIEKVKKLINIALDYANDNSYKGYKIEFSMGSALEEVVNEKDFSNLMHQADSDISNVRY